MKTSSPIYLALDGCHGVGTSTHADALAEALRGEHFAAAAYHHPRHDVGCGGAARVAWYAGARAQLVAHPIAPVVVMDRGPMSGVAYARSLNSESGLANHLARIDASSWCHRHDLSWVWLDAPDATLDARILARQETPSMFKGERAAWRELVLTDGFPRRPTHLINSAGDAANVRADLLAWAIAVILLRMGAR